MIHRLEVQDYLLQLSDLAPMEALAQLESEYSIKHQIWNDQLVTLNYCQIDSPKINPITKECRSLVLELGTWDLVSQSFTRFYNWGETGSSTMPVEDGLALEKVDGSLIGLFNYKGQWLYRTRSMIMPVAIINGNVGGITWDERIEDDLKVFFSRWDLQMPLGMDATYIFELTCRENRVVTKYDHEGGKLVLLAIRNRVDGGYVSHEGQEAACESFGWRKCETYSFNTIEDALNSAKNLRELQEGYVVTDADGVPQYKMKNPAYVAAHHLRGNGPITERRLLDLLIMNETDEYLSIFPEDTEVFQPYVDAYKLMNGRICEMADYVALSVIVSASQKDFAISIKDSPIKGLAFSYRKGILMKDAWENCTRQAKYSMILAYKGKFEDGEHDPTGKSTEQ